MANRIIEAIAKMKQQIADRLAQGIVTAAKVAEADKGMNIEFDEFVAFQNLKSQAHVMGKLSLEEAQTIYGYLGEAGPEHFNSQAIEVKAVLNKVLAELLQTKIAMSRRNNRIGSPLGYRSN